jgi:hypothetical protein
LRGLLPHVLHSLCLARCCFALRLLVNRPQALFRLRLLLWSRTGANGTTCASRPGGGLSEYWTRPFASVHLYICAPAGSATSEAATSRVRLSGWPIMMLS